MRKFLNFLYTLPLRFRFTSILMILFLFAMMFIYWLVTDNSSSGPQDPGITAGNLGLVASLLKQLILLITPSVGFLTFVIDIGLSWSKPVDNKLSLVTHIFWIISLLGLYPIFYVIYFVP